MLHIPLLRKGEPYKSLDVVRVVHHRTREPFAEISQANGGLIRRDLTGQEQARRALAAFSVRELIEMSVRAAEIFAHDELPIGEEGQTPEQYVEQVSATTGLPHALARRNMEKIRGALSETENVLRGLTRNLELEILDRGYGEIEGRAVSFFPRGQSLGVVLPSNSPGVHSLWVPAVALKIPLVLKPGGAEPWTPYRIVQAFIKAGVPRAAFGYYPTGHGGAAEILRHTGRGMAFGDVASVSQWQEDGRVEIHGPGYSKVVIGDDLVDEWENYLDVMAASIADNGGRSCVNASGVWVTRHADEIAEALAARLAEITPRAAADERAQLAPFADARVAARISQMIDEGLREAGARDVSAEQRRRATGEAEDEAGGGRLREWESCAYLLPTVVRCASAAHALANREFLFPFASVVEVGREELPEALGTSLVVTAITRDEELIAKLLASPHVDRLNVGAIPTTRISWDQPHEGNLFEHLYARRAFQRAPPATTTSTTGRT
ncbi:MAG TPA: aldehyde dehydrogenase family protein [Pyrinomonadaceae bacterium]|nr:aldehyde dehydrogenase family protein [Pyrinomonadaceae bacterium]